MNDIGLNLDSLPSEVIEKIFSCDCLSYIDICRISTVSQLFNCISKSNKLWSYKFFQKWPTVGRFFDVVTTNWKEEAKKMIIFRRAIYDKLYEMTKEFYHLDNVSNDSFYNFKTICNGHPLTDHILVAELGRITSDSNNYSNLTLKYYAEKALVYVRHTMLDTVWRTFLDIKPRPSLLKGACLIQQWCQPSKIGCTKEVSKKINSIIEMVFNEIKEVSPNHPVINRGYSPVKNETSEVLEKSLWNAYQCKTILNCMNHVLYTKLNWSCVEYSYSAENIFVDKALEKGNGIPVTQGILYEAIASQLGVRLIPVNFPGQFLLKFIEHPECSGESAWSYIDITAGGVSRKGHEMQDLAPGYENFSNTWLEPVSPVKVFARMCWNLVEVGRQHDESGEGLSCLCNSLELLSILCPLDLEHKLLLARVYMHLCVNITRVIDLLQEIASNDPNSTGIVGYMYRTAITTLETQQIKKQNKKLKCQKRDEECADVKFAVGMIMTHKKYNYRCVIYGWDPLCTASRDWIFQMGVNKLKYKDKQPFYHVLVADGTNRYAAQENLEIDPVETPITHMEVGRYFESFHGKYYLPNEQKGLEYPDDVEARERNLSESPHPQM